jgi:hypothetical protein
MPADKYNPNRDITPKFIATVNSWIEASGEVVVILRYLRAAGAKDYALIDSPDRFQRLVEVCPTGTDIVVCRDAQLPLRGRVDDDFIERAKGMIPVGSEYLFVCLKPRGADDPRLFGAFNSGVNLVEDLEEFRGEEVALGLCPRFMGPDNEGMISASKGGIDGPR